MKIYIANAYWCENTWAIAAGRNQDAVERYAEKYMEQHHDEYNEQGHFKNPDANGKCAEGYNLEEVEESV